MIYFTEHSQLVWHVWNSACSAANTRVREKTSCNKNYAFSETRTRDLYTYQNYTKLYSPYKQ